MHALLMVAAIGIVPNETVAADSVDVIEVNHYYDHHGQLVFDQVIFWRWLTGDQERHVVAWRMLKHTHQTPRRDWRRGGYFMIWVDHEMLRRVGAKVLQETWTQYDPEVQDRQCVPLHRRRGLLGEH